ncbi:putative GTPase activating protein [Naematelia encephala]|uniref:Putative GTPase activating protein n=1 Tax=Naematelia encephala TaxID=71784 RepID=A0A1Y2BKY6_9TREE|nr:putative GTPase activating protein [Naematelia encephala]
MARPDNVPRDMSVPAPLPVNEVTELEHDTRELGINGKPRRRVRESHVESADQAAGIFSLYGDARQSWQSDKSNGNVILGAEIEFDSGQFAILEEQEEGVEELREPEAWNGQLAPNNIRSDVAPPITITPDHSATHTPDKRYTSNRASTLTTSTMDSPTSTRLQHPNVAGLSPRQHSTATTLASASASQISFTGSSQYPGEENDAFHVRSTYARLEAEGVHGDGWDPGVERTRGGPQAGKRVTMQPALKQGDVGEKEREFLVSLDRYGFINEPLRNRSETRLALIPAAPLRKIPKLPSRSPMPKREKPPAQTGFLPGNSEAGPSPRVPSSPAISGEDEKHRRKETERVGKWMKMMKVDKRDPGGNISSWVWRSDGQGAKLPTRVYKGIPDRWRMAAWWTMAEDRTEQAKGKGRASREAEDLISEYRVRETLDYTFLIRTYRYDQHQIDLPSTHDVQIDLDVPRTISGHTLFVTRYGTGQRSLFHVLHSFSLVCDSCGYCQGMGPIAATLLCYFDPERAYTLLVRLHDVYGMHSIFGPGFPGLLEAFYVQERLMEWLMPDVYRSFQRNMISSSAWGTKWYITLFVNTVPFSQQLRLWDALWLDGRDIMVLASIAILWSFKDLLAAPTATFESILSLLSSYFVAEDEDALMRWIRKMINSPGMRDKISMWRKEWLGLVQQGKSDQALL